MPKNSKDIPRSVYVFEFIDNSVYVGITKDINRRLMDHKHSGKVSKKIKVGISYEFKILENELLPEKALDMEEFYIKKYRQEGYNLLNSEHTVRSLGSLSSHKWIFTELEKEASKYSGRKEFERGSPRAYQAAVRKGLIEELFKDKPLLKRTWTNEEVFREAKKFNSRYEFSQKASAAYKTAQVRGLLDEICSHMVKPRTIPKKIYWVEKDKYYSGIRELTRVLNKSRYFVRARVRGLIKNTKGYTFVYV